MLNSYNFFKNKILVKVVYAISTDNKLGDFNDGSSGTGNDYTYDANGNLTQDNNKNISSISYNYLNLPQVNTITGKGTITYTYDAAGNKLKKVTVDNSATGKTITTTTTYIGGSVYESKTTVPANTPNDDYTDRLLFGADKEGRIRVLYDNAATPNTPTNAVYDYFLKDHLGNVRMVLTEEQKADMYPAATLEPATIANESIYYGNLTSTQYAKPSWFSDPLYTTNTKVAQLKNATGVQKIGPSILLKVMAGDSYNIRVASGWSSGSSATNSSTNVLNDLFSALTTGLAGISGGKATATQLQNTGSGINAGLTSFLSTQTTSGTKPKAYINWILFDEQFKIVTGSSGFEQVGASGVTTIHTRTNLSVTRSGYLYVYTSNEATNIDVFFDNLQVTHTRGALLEENSFYPFGLVMSGISSKALGFGEPTPGCGCGNKKLFNGNEIQNKEFSDGSGLELYDFNARTYDQQIGRFIQIDPTPEDGEQKSLTPYHFSGNNPSTFSDPNGKCPWCIGAIIGGVGGFIYGAAKYGFKKGGWKKVLATTAAGAVGGATLGLGTGAIIGAGGATTMSAAGATMAEGGVAILSGATTSLTDQGVSMVLGAQDKFDGADVTYSMTLAVPELLLSKAVVDPIGNSVKSELSGAITDGAIHTLTAKERGSIVKGVAKNLRKEIGSGITRKQSKVAAEKIVNIMQTTEQHEIGVGIKIIDNAVKVTGVIVGNAVDDTSKDKIKN